MKFSIIVCTRNRGSKLHKLFPFFQKLNPALDFEIIFVDNNSTDNTLEILHKYSNELDRLKVLSCEKVGLGAAREYARKQAQGDILIFTDDDCYPAESFLDGYGEIFKDETISYAGSRILLWDEADARVTVDYRETIEHYQPFQFIPAGKVQGANFAVRKKALNSIGGYDENLGAGTAFPCEDIDVVGRLSFAGFLGCFNPKAVIYHHHGRKENDIPDLMKSYDYGRGAYYMKMILSKESRALTLKYFLKHSIKPALKSPKNMRRAYRELLYAYKYYRKHG